MRRKNGTGLVRNEVLLLEIAVQLEASGEDRFYGYDLVQSLRATGRRRAVMSQPTLYRSLRRLEQSGFLRSKWETIEQAAADGRDGRPRRYYRLTPQGRAIGSAAE